jgi:PIN domain nuclease of toxin-antitoxin system
MILLDTHAWVWWLSNPDKLSVRARKTIDAASAAGEAHVSAISCWEVALLVERGRLVLTVELEDWMTRASGLPYFRFVDVDPWIAVRSVRLAEPFHADPADRITVATALRMSAKLVTRDRNIRDYPHVKTIW